MRKKYLYAIMIIFMMVCIISACRIDEILMPTMVHEDDLEPACTGSFGQDPLGNAYLSAAAIDGTKILGWSTSKFPDDYEFNDYAEEFIPQARDRRLYLQDISARYVPKAGTPYQIDLDRKTLEQIYEDLSGITGEYAEFNRQFIKTIITKKDNIHCIAVNDTYSVDLNRDGNYEVLSLNKSPSQRIVADSEIQISIFSVMIDGITKLSFEYEDLEVYYVHLGTCEILIVQPLGYNASYGGDYAYTYKHKAQVYQSNDGVFSFIGLIDGGIDLVVGEGRFTTLGDADTSPHNDGPVYEVVREYLIKDNKIYQILHEWQYARTIWQLKKDLPIYKEKNTADNNRKIPAGSFVMIVAYSPDGWLKLISDQNINGYVKITLDENGYWDAYPYAMPGGETMESYFEEYGGIAG